MKILVIIICLITMNGNIVYGSEYTNGNDILEYLNTYDFEKADGIINNKSSINNFSLKEIILKIGTGLGTNSDEFSISSIVDIICNIFLSEIYASQNIIRNIILISICSAFLKTLAESFKFNSVGKLGFYIMYVLIITLLITSFEVIYSYAEELINNLNEFIISSIPLILSGLLMSGNTNTAVISQPIFLTLSYILVYILKNILMPFIYMIFIAEIFNNLSDKQVLKELISTSKKIITFSIKFLLYVFLGVVSMFRIATPISDGILKKTFQSSVSFVPVVGGTLSGAVDTVYYFSNAIKSGLGIAIVIGVFVLASVFIIKIFALQIVYYFISILIDPICDKKITNAFNSLKLHIGYILAMLTSSIFMFAISALLMLTV